MDWTGTMKKYGWGQEFAYSEPFSPLAAQVQQLRAQGHAVARITCTLGTSVEYGAVKCSFTVSIECPQQEAAMNLAGEAAYYKALELTNDAAGFLGLPEVGK